MATASKKKPISKKSDGGRNDITLMTLLANEATSDSRKLLKSYNKPDAKTCGDLEVKLAELYFGQSDKKKLEKELSDIHPHKDWILKSQVTEPIIEEKEIEVESVGKPTESISEPQSCPKCEALKHSNFMSFDGPTNSSSRQISMIDYMGIIGMMATIGLTFYVIAKHK